MSVKNHTYATKSTAKRGVQRHGIANAALIEREDGCIEVRDLDRPLYNHAAREKSATKGAVAIVWDLAAKMIGEGAKRKEIVEACVAQGVALNTAKTQIQYYRKAAGLVKGAEA